MRRSDATIWRHSQSLDWCHICGLRSTDTVDVWYADNAENGARPGEHYIRICADCGERIRAVARGERPGTEAAPDER